MPQKLQGVPSNEATYSPERLSVDKEPNGSGKSHRQPQGMETHIDRVAMPLGVVHQEPAQDSWAGWVACGHRGGLGRFRDWMGLNAYYPSLAPGLQSLLRVPGLSSRASRNAAEGIWPSFNDRGNFSPRATLLDGSSCAVYPAGGAGPFGMSRTFRVTGRRTGGNARNESAASVDGRPALPISGGPGVPKRGALGQTGIADRRVRHGASPEIPERLPP